MSEKDLMPAENANPVDSPSTLALREVARKQRNRSRELEKWLKRFAWTVFLGGVAAVLVTSWLPKPIPVDLVLVASGPMRVSVDEDGRARVRDRYIVSAPLGGRIGRTELHAGDAVKLGAIISQITPLAPALLDGRSRQTAEAQIAAAQAARGQTKAQLVRAEATLAFATGEAKRTQQLVQAGAAAGQTLEQSQLEERTAAAELESLRFASNVAEHELRMARATLSRSDGKGEELDVPSPVDGRILKVLQESEGAVAAGAPLIEIGDPSALEIVVDVLTSDAVSIHPGAAVTIGAWGGPDLPARVRTIEPSAFTRLSALGVEEQRVNVVIDLEGKHAEWKALGDGYRVEAKIVVWEAKAAVQVPSSAVFRHGTEWAVFRAVAGKAVLTPVTIDHRNAQQVEITQGLESATQVVLHPSDRVVDGAPIAQR